MTWTGEELDLISRINDKINNLAKTTEYISKTTTEQKAGLVVTNLQKLTNNKTILDLAKLIKPALTIIVGAVVVAIVYRIITSQESVTSILSYVMIIVVVIGIIYVLSKFGGK